MSNLQPPTSRLPPIGRISSHSTEVLLDSLRYLRLVYNPEVRGSRRRRLPRASIHPEPRRDIPKDRQDTGVNLDIHGHMSANILYFDSSDLDLLRSDSFERSFAIRWLTALISQVDSWEAKVGTTSASPDLPPTQAKDILIQEAASLLAVCAGAAAAGTLTRIFTFGSENGELKVQLTDVPLENHDFASVGAQTWGGACVLAETIVDQPGEFGLVGGSDELLKESGGSVAALRVLELGAGTGLVSLIVGKLLQSSAERIRRRATILATDFYPSVLANLQTNVRSNFPASNEFQGNFVQVDTHFLDWSQVSETDTQKPPFDQPFDLVLGADIIYEAQHAVWIKTCLTCLLRKPINSQSQPLFHLIIPLRPTHASESSTVETVFPQAGIRTPGQVDEPTHLAIFSKEIIACDTGIETRDRARGEGEVEYAYYKIGWC